MNIEWRPIPGFELRYEVSSDGEVRSLLKRGRHRQPFAAEPTLLRQIKRRDGYKTVVLTLPDKNTTYLVHRLVAAAFIGPIPNGMHAAHLDGNKENNRASNLAIVTPTENNRHKVSHGTNRGGANLGADNPWSKLTDTDVREIRRAYAAKEAIQVELAATYGVSQNCISTIVRGKGWRHV